jgi:uncharacterized protein (DUF1697 family)
MEPNRMPLTDYTDRELLQLIVVSLVQVEKRTARIENFIAKKFGIEFHDFMPREKEDLKKVIIDYHYDALSEMESN